MAAAIMTPLLITALPGIKHAERHTYYYKRKQGDLECIAGSKYQAWILMRAHGFDVDIEKIQDLGVPKYKSGSKPIG